MVRYPLRTVLLVAVAILAAGAMAATLDAGELPTDNGTGQQPDFGGNATVVPPPGGAGGSLSWPQLSCPAPLASLPGFAAFVCLALAGSGAALRRRGSVALAVVAIAVPVLGLVTVCPAVLTDHVPLLADLSETVPSTPVLVGGLVIALCGALAFLYLVSDDRASLDVEEAPGEDAVDLRDVAEAAGDAADRIERQADVSNEVYRAWREMVQHLDVSGPDATTPDEFEARAVEAGMRHRDVAELTRLFEEVRYGERDPDVRADDAVTALRRIENAYAPDGPTDESGGQGGRE